MPIHAPKFAINHRVKHVVKPINGVVISINIRDGGITYGVTWSDEEMDDGDHYDLELVSQEPPEFSVPKYKTDLTVGDRVFHVLDTEITSEPGIISSAYIRTSGTRYDVVWGMGDKDFHYPLELTKERPDRKVAK